MLLQKLRNLSMVLAVVLLGMGVVVGFLTPGAAKAPRLNSKRIKRASRRARRKPFRRSPARSTCIGVFSTEISRFMICGGSSSRNSRNWIWMETPARSSYQADSARLSPDGRLLAFGLAEGSPPKQLQIRDVTKDDPPKAIVNMPRKELSRWCWSPDGKQLSFAVWGDENDEKYHPYIVDVATRKIAQGEAAALEGKRPGRLGRP